MRAIILFYTHTLSTVAQRERERERERKRERKRESDGPVSLKNIREALLSVPTLALAALALAPSYHDGVARHLVVQRLEVGAQGLLVDSHCGGSGGGDGRGLAGWVSRW